MGKSKGFRIVYGLTLVVFLVSGMTLLVRIKGLQKGEEYYQSLRAETETAVVEETAYPVKESVSDASERQEEITLSQRFLKAAEEGAGMAFWIKIPGTAVDYPVMLGDDNQFYLNHLPDGTKNISGSLFLDYRTDAECANWIIYGHNSSSGKMFGGLKQYESAEYFTAHDTVMLVLEDTVYVCPIFSVRHVPADDEAYTFQFTDEEHMRSYIEQAAEASLYEILIPSENVEGIVTLSTCTAYRGKRLIVQAFLKK